jgi:hypothetical protein
MSNQVYTLLKNESNLKGMIKASPHGAWVCCPYHGDRTPSLHVHGAKGMAKCFSCGEFRTVFEFLLEWGVPMEGAIDYAFNFNPGENVRDSFVMKEYKLGRHIPKSMVDRGFTVETLQTFNVGYDSYEQHITIPMLYNENLYGIKFRQYPKDFWFSDGFVKENFIYNYAPTDERYYVESETDTWRTFQNGTENVSALLGSDITEKQAELMSKHKRIYLAFDNDKAGWRAAFKAHDMLRHDVELWVIPYAAEDTGACPEDEWRKAIQQPKTFMEFELALMKRNPTLYDELTKVRSKSLRELMKGRT